MKLFGLVSLSDNLHHVFPFIFKNRTPLTTYSQIFLSWHLGAERQTCHVTLIVPHVMN